MERFACRTTVVSGEGALSVLGKEKCRRLLLVAEPEDTDSFGARKIKEAAGCNTTEYYDQIDPDPSMLQALEGTRKLKEFMPDLVVALGGTHVMECAKAMVGFSRQDCRLVAVPTVCGSGTEVTDRVILTHNGCRHLLQDDGMRPDIAILTEQMGDGAARSKVAEGGFELLAAAAEAYTAWGGGLIADIHAREAFVAGWGSLSAAYAGNQTARKRLLTASAMVGMAQEQTGLGLCQALENSLGSIFSLSRGKLAGILLPAVIGCNAHAAGKKYAELSRAAGMGGSSEGLGMRNLKTGLIRLRRELGLPGTLAQAGVNPRSVWSNVQRITERTLEDPACRNNPVTVDDFMVRRILEEIAGRL